MSEVDVLIIGAGLSGIGAACHLTRNCPNLSYAVIERRERIGGTWDLFRYPGVRSDSDMFTLGYNFRPWTQAKSLADGASIREYVVDTANEYDVPRHIRFSRRVVSASWSSEESRWTVGIEDESTGELETYSCKFLLSCTGYYNYDAGYTPDFDGVDDYKGQLIHPQQWPENLDYKDKKVLIIGSGATAVTLLPAMADDAEHVTMLQRSPTYVASVPEEDKFAISLRKFLPEMMVYRMARARNIGFQRFVYKLSQEKPKVVRRALLSAVKKQVGKDFDMSHFTPKYNPWEERLCAVPGGDLFKVIRAGKASVVTDHIDTFTERGIRLKSGKELEADIIVTATGLDIQMLGGVDAEIDGQHVTAKDTLVYRGVMLRDVPNMGMIFGYTNASWTLKADIASEYICRILNHMQDSGATQVVPRSDEDCATDKTILDMRSGYIQRAADSLPKQGSKAPWKVLQNYLSDLPSLRYGKLNDGALDFNYPEKEKKKGLLASILG